MYSRLTFSAFLLFRLPSIGCTSSPPHCPALHQPHHHQSSSMYSPRQVDRDWRLRNVVQQLRPSPHPRQQRELRSRTYQSVGRKSRCSYVPCRGRWRSSSAHDDLSGRAHRDENDVAVMSLESEKSFAVGSVEGDGHRSVLHELIGGESRSRCSLSNSCLLNGIASDLLGSRKEDVQMLADDCRRRRSISKAFSVPECEFVHQLLDPRRFVQLGCSRMA